MKWKGTKNTNIKQNVQKMLAAMLYAGSQGPSSA
jgi:hypothetical protein